MHWKVTSYSNSETPWCLTKAGAMSLGRKGSLLMMLKRMNQQDLEKKKKIRKEKKELFGPVIKSVAFKSPVEG